MDNVVAILNRERAAAMERLDALTSEGRDLRQRVREIDNAVTLLNGHTPVAKPTRTSGGNLQALILSCVRSYGREGVTVRDVAQSLTVSGRETSEPSVSSTLSRMKNEGDVENSNGKWFVTPEVPAAVSSSDSFDVLDPVTNSTRPSPFDDDDSNVPF